MPMKPQLLDIFARNFVYDGNRGPRYVGMEGEFPVVYRDGKAVDYSLIRGMFRYLEQQGFSLKTDAATGELLGAKRLARHSVGETQYNQDVISTDTGYSIIEISPAPAANLRVLQQVFDELMALLLVYFEANNALILGYGVQPVSSPGSQLMASNSRYQLFKRWSANRLIPQKVGFDCDFLTVTASNQTHIDVHESEAIDAVNVINGLSGLQIILHANSPFWAGEFDVASKAVRETFWDYCFPSRSNQVGIPVVKFSDLADYVDYLCNFRMQAVERDG